MLRSLGRTGRRIAGALDVDDAAAVVTWVVRAGFVLASAAVLGTAVRIFLATSGFGGS